MTDATDTEQATADRDEEVRRPEDTTVLVVDDEPDVVTYLSSVLEDAGIRVRTAHDGEEALDILRSHEVDLISMDLVMPRKSGIRLLVELRKNKAWSRIPVIFVTGHAHDPGVRRDVSEALADSTMSGPSMYLEKPVTPASYLGHVAKVLRIPAPQAKERPDLSEVLRRKAKTMLEDADPATLEAVIDRLKGAKP
jgi:CheY-like chemotaxis protein